MGLSLLRSSHEGDDASGFVPSQAKDFFNALSIGLTNPKVIMFFMAFFPLFMARDATPWTLVGMVVHVTGISLVYQTLLVVGGNVLARRLTASPFARSIGRRLIGASLIGFGVRLATAER
jgi:threonine/homoserine/homoserine lactone efflux protein